MTPRCSFASFDAIGKSRSSICEYKLIIRSGSCNSWDTEYANACNSSLEHELRRTGSQKQFSFALLSHGDMKGLRDFPRLV